MANTQNPPAIEAEINLTNLSKQVIKDKIFDSAGFRTQFQTDEGTRILESLSRTGVLTFLEKGPNFFYPERVAEFYANATIRDEGATIASRINEVELIITESTISQAFELPSEGYLATRYGAGNEKLKWSEWKSADCKESFTLTTRKKMLKPIYGTLLDITTKMVTGDVGSFGELSARKYAIMMALDDGASINWTDFVFGRIKDQVAKNSTVRETGKFLNSVGYGLRISQLLEHILGYMEGDEHITGIDFIPRKKESKLSVGRKEVLEHMKKHVIRTTESLIEKGEKWKSEETARDPGPGEQEHLQSFLKFLLPVLRLRLKSFKIATGKRLDEELVVDVIKFSGGSLQSYNFPFNSKRVEAQDVQFASHALRIEQGSASASAIVSQVEKIKGTKRKISTEEVVDVERSTIRHVKPKVFVVESSGGSLQVQDMQPSGSSTLPLLDMPLHQNEEVDVGRESFGGSVQDTQPSGSSTLRLLDASLHQNVPPRNDEQTVDLNVQKEDEKVVVKVKYGKDSIKFDMCLSSGVNKLREELSKRLNLGMGSLKFTYVDEDNDEILLACDDDLLLCPTSQTAAGKTCIQLLAQLVPK